MLDPLAISYPVPGKAESTTMADKKRVVRTCIYRPSCSRLAKLTAWSWKYGTVLAYNYYAKTCTSSQRRTAGTCVAGKLNKHEIHRLLGEKYFTCYFHWQEALASRAGSGRRHGPYLVHETRLDDLPIIRIENTVARFGQRRENTRVFF
jgi:hypothetical protein